MQLSHLLVAEGDERWNKVTGLATDVPNIESIRKAAVCQKKRTIILLVLGGMVGEKERGERFDAHVRDQTAP